MKIPIIIISGFLGAGKTTFIQQLLKTYSNPKELMIIENDFGKANFDSLLLQQQGIRIEELNSGCICCSLSGDFKKSLQTVLETNQVSLLIIEPSGVGKLSDIIASCESEEISDKVDIVNTITIIDAKNCMLYAQNFGEFFNDQIQYAHTIILNYTTEDTDIDQTLSLLRQINPHALLYTQPFESYHLSNKGVQFPEKQEPPACNHTRHAIQNEHQHSCTCHHETACSCHHDEHCHHHNAHDTFSQCELALPATYTKEELLARLLELQDERYGSILRAKGVVTTERGNYLVQYTPSRQNVTPTTLAPTELTIIGKDLQIKELYRLWGVEK